MPVQPQEVRQQLERIASSAGFKDAGRLAPFLRFVVERALSGDPIKEAVVGVEVFSRPAGYDPRVDPIVRVEARRLRSRLAEYYAGPGASDPVYIDLPKGTYIPVFTVSEPPRPAEEPPSVPSWRSLVHWRAGVALAAILAVALIAAVLISRRSSASPPVVAVLPFVNMSEDKANEYFSDGLTEELIDRLAKAPGLRVVGRSSTFHFKGRSQDLREVGRNLNATAVVEGSVRRSGDRLRITAQLIDVEDGLHLWSETYERTMSDVFAIQDDLARSIASALRAELSTGIRLASQAPTANLAAYEMYLKGRRHMNQDAMAGLELAADQFEQAVAADPRFAVAHAWLAVDYSLLAYYKLRAPDDAWPKAKSAAARAIALDSKLAAGHAALGFALATHDWKWEEAGRSLRRAVELEPRSADARVAFAVAYLMPKGRLKEASAEFTRALELDPQLYLANIGAGFNALCAGNYAEAITHYRRAVEINPSHADAQWDLGMAYAYAGRKEDAMRQFRLGGQINRPGSWQPGGVEFALMGELDAGHRYMAETDLAEQRPMFVAYAYGALGDASRTAAWLEKAFAARDPQLIWLKIDPRIAKVRNDARVASLINRLGLDAQ